MCLISFIALLVSDALASLLIRLSSTLIHLTPNQAQRHRLLQRVTRTLIILYPSRFTRTTPHPERLSYQRFLDNDPVAYYVSLVDGILQQINVAYLDGSGSRKVRASTQLLITGETANYHYGTNSAYKFHNAMGGIP